MNSEAFRFYSYYSLKMIREQWIGIVGAVVPPLYYLLFLFLVFATWKRFNSSLGNFTPQEALVYIGINQLLFMGFMSFGGISRAAGDFSMALARPRSWLGMNFFSLFSKELTNRGFYLALLSIVLIINGFSGIQLGQIAIKLIVMVPILTVAQSLYNLCLASARVVWHQVSYFSLPIHKVFLIGGGIIAPLHEYAEPWRHLALALPFADLFFQPAYLCVKGHFFGITSGEWLIRIGIQILVLIGLNITLFSFAKVKHEAYGG